MYVCKVQLVQVRICGKLLQISKSCTILFSMHNTKLSFIKLKEAGLATEYNFSLRVMVQMAIGGEVGNPTTTKWTLY